MTANIDNAKEGKGVGKTRDKEIYRGYKVFDAENVERGEYCDVRLYCARTGERNTVYCVAWFNRADPICRGVGKAGGYGYHHESAALSDALDDAGIVLSQAIDGRGDGAMREALTAVAAACGAVKPFIVEFYA